MTYSPKENAAQRSTRKIFYLKYDSREEKQRRFEADKAREAFRMGAYMTYVTRGKRSATQYPKDILPQI